MNGLWIKFRFGYIVRLELSFKVKVMNKVKLGLWIKFRFGLWILSYIWSLDVRLGCWVIFLIKDKDRTQVMIMDQG